MLAPSSTSLLTRFLYSLAVFASDQALGATDQRPGPLLLLLLLGGFIVLRTGATWLFDQWKPGDRQRAVKLLREVLLTFTDTNWTALLLILAQWVVDLLEGWWLLIGDPIPGIFVLEGTLLVTTALLYAAFRTSAELGPAGLVADNVLANLNFAIAFFIAAQLGTERLHGTGPWMFVMLAGAIGLLHIAMSRLFDEWTAAPNSAATGRGAAQGAGGRWLKAVFLDNAHTILSIGVFVLVNLFSNLFHAWWAEGEHWLVAFSVFTTVLLLGLGALQAVQALAPAGATQPAGTDEMVNRGLFAMTMFLAEKARARLKLDLSEFELLILSGAFIALSAALDTLLAEWRPERSGRRARAARGEKALKATVEQDVRTWVTIGLVFVVRLLVDRFATWWRTAPSAAVGAVLVEGAALLLVAAVKLVQAAEAPRA